MKNLTKKTFWYFLGHMKPYKWLYALMTCTLISGVIIELIVPLYYKDIFDLFLASTEVTKANVASEMFSILVMLSILFSLEFIVWRVIEFSSNYFQPRIMSNIRNQCFEYLNKHSYRFFSDNFSGALVRKVNRLVYAFENFIDRMFWDFTGLIVRIIGVIIVIYLYSWLLSLIMLVWLIIFVVSNYYLARWKYPLDVAANEADSNISANLSDVISNYLNVKLFTSYSYEQGRFEEKSEQWRSKIKKSWDLNAKINAGQSAFMMILELVIVYVTIYLWSGNLVTAGFFVLVQSYLLQLLIRIWDFRRMIQDVFNAFADAEEMIEILNTEHEVKDKAGAHDLIVKKGEIEFQKVSFNYPENQKVLLNFNLRIRPGEKVALVGHSGEGKTTITKLLMRLFDIQKGEIFFDGQNIAGVTLDSLRRNISLVPQDPILFHRSLLDNIRYGKRNATKEDVVSAAQLANCHDFILKTKNGYNTFVGERGIKLSGGERQRIAIARAILEDARVVILDEATSSLDSYSEKLIQQALKRLLKGKTAIMIAHRLSTIMEADRIVVIQEGKIAEEGTHQHLLSKENGVYKKLWEIQAGGFIGE